MNFYTTSGVIFAMLVAHVLPALASDIYRYRMPDGTILYTDKVSKKGLGRLQEIIVSPAPDTKQVEEEQRAKIKREEARANHLAAQRMASLNTVEHDIHDLSLELAKAKAAATTGVEPKAGERLGIKGGHTRLSPVYWARQRKLQQAVDDLHERLDDAYSARNALR